MGFFGVITIPPALMASIFILPKAFSLSWAMFCAAYLMGFFIYSPFAIFFSVGLFIYICDEGREQFDLKEILESFEEISKKSIQSNLDHYFPTKDLTERTRRSYPYYKPCHYQLKKILETRRQLELEWMELDPKFCKRNRSLVPVKT